MHQFADRVIMDCTHSVQSGAAGGKTGGQQGVYSGDGIGCLPGLMVSFLRRILHPDEAKSDGPNMLYSRFVTSNSILNIIKPVMSKCI